MTYFLFITAVALYVGFERVEGQWRLQPRTTNTDGVIAILVIMLAGQAFFYGDSSERHSKLCEKQTMVSTAYGAPYSTSIAEAHPKLCASLIGESRGY